MNLLPPLPIMEKWRAEGLSPEQVKAQADLWVREARRALRQPAPPPKPRPKPNPMPTLGSVTGLKPGPVPGAKLKPGPIPVIPKRFPPRPKDGRSRPAGQPQRASKKLPSLETLVELYQTHTMQEIADMYQVGVSSVGRHLKKAEAVTQKRQARKQAREEQQQLLGGNIKLPNVEQLEELYKTHNLREIGAMYGASTEAVAYHLRKVGAIERKRKDKESADLEQIREMRGQGASWGGIAKILHRSTEYLTKLAKEAGMETVFALLVICPECDENPYAKGLCRRCYEWVRRNKAKLSPEEQVRVKERAGLAKRPGTYRREWRPQALERVRRIQALRQQGKTFKQIQAETGIHESTACALLKRYERQFLEQSKEN